MRISDWSSDVCSSDLNFAKNARVRTAERSAGRSPAHGRPRRPRRLSQEPVRHAGDGGGDRAFRDQRLLLAPGRAGDGAGAFAVCRTFAVNLNKDRKSVCLGMRVSVSVDLGGHRTSKTNNTKKKMK